MKRKRILKNMIDILKTTDHKSFDKDVTCRVSAIEKWSSFLYYKMRQAVLQSVLESIRNVLGRYQKVGKLLQSSTVQKANMRQGKEKGFRLPTP